ncbi:MAG: hypothetical protein RBQ97_01360 [Acholeplasma sp.]|jgi:hypothetical protein|nr:hypothetical protein [Acholeplasma sp.]
MEDLIGLWFGFIGIVVGAIITFITEIYIRKGQMKFDISIEVRKSLIALNDKLVSLQKDILNVNDFCDQKSHKENILAYKTFHEEIMNQYKTYRIHLGDLKAYELNSAIYKYYREYAFHHQNTLTKVSNDDYRYSYLAIKDCVGLMINEVRFELVKINSLKKNTKEELAYKRQEYYKYVKRIIDWLNLESTEDLITEFKHDQTNYDPIYKATEVIVERLCPFVVEVASIKSKIDIPKYLPCNFKG